MGAAQLEATREDVVRGSGWGLGEGEQAARAGGDGAWPPAVGWRAGGGRVGRGEIGRAHV